MLYHSEKVRLLAATSELTRNAPDGGRAFKCWSVLKKPRLKSASDVKF